MPMNTKLASRICLQVSCIGRTSQHKFKQVLMNLGRLILLSICLLASGIISADVSLEPDEYVVFYHHDVLGSPVMATNDQGYVLWHERHSPYGKSEGRISQNGNAFGDNALPEAESRQGYTGHMLDNSAGLTYMKARYYDHSIGRFLSNDPVGFIAANPMMFNRYSYAAGNPYKYFDPDGRYITTAAKDKEVVIQALAEMANESPRLQEIVYDLLESDMRHHVSVDGSVVPQNNAGYTSELIPHESGDPSKAIFRTGSITHTDPTKEEGYDIELLDGGIFNSSAMSTFIHEMTHAHQRDQGRLDLTPSGNEYPKAENESMENGNVYRENHGEKIRDGY